MAKVTKKAGKYYLPVKGTTKTYKYIITNNLKYIYTKIELSWFIIYNFGTEIG